MSDTPSLNAVDLNDLSQFLQRKRHEATLILGAADAIERIQGLGATEIAAQGRRDTIEAGIVAARAELADAQAAKEQAISSATTEAAKIVDQAKADADSIKTQARGVVAAELADTNRELEAARQELAGLNDRIAKARDALAA